jgi:hypothetical protein
MRELSDVYRYANKLMTDNSQRNVAFDAYRSMYHAGWDLPPAIQNIEWIQKVINADCYDAVQTGMRILSTIPLSLTYQPMAPGLDNKERANITETVLKWNLMAANRRRSRKIESEIAKNALLYDLCAVQVVDLEYQINEKKKLSLPTKREESALAHGRFMYIPYDSRSVYPEWSNLMLERVLIVQHKHAAEVVDEWGSAATKHPELVDLTYQPYGSDWVTFYELWDMETRTAWATQGQQWDVSTVEDQQRWVLTHGNNPTSFIPFAIRGGTTTETNRVHAYLPLLYPVYATGAWDIKNLIRSLEVSEVAAHTGMPRLVEEGPNMQVAQIDYMSPDRVAKMPPQNTLREVQPAAIDAALAGVDALLSAQISKSTISDVLQGGELPSGTAFATLNLMTQTAVGVLQPFKHLTEITIADMLAKTLEWVSYTDKDLYGYGTGRNDAGQEYKIIADEIEPSAIYLSVELHPDTPTDRGQKIQAASMAVEALDMSLESALEEIGIENPGEEVNRRTREKILQHEMDLEFSREMMEMESKIQIQTQAAIMALQMKMQEAQIQAQGGQGGPPPMPGGQQEGVPQEPPPGGFVQQGNPAAGAPPPAMFNPEEQAQGSGVPMAPEGGGQLI